MKKITLILSLVMAALSLQAISPYYLVADVEGDLNTVEASIESALEEQGFIVIGKYNPMENKSKRVIVYSSDHLQKLCSKVTDRGMLAAALKVAIWDRNGKIRVSMLNPEYLFYAYLRDEGDQGALKGALQQINESAITAMKAIGTTMKPFGGDIEVKKLKEYKYMMGMPKFDAPVELNEFSSFEQGVGTIHANLNAGKGSMAKVFEIIDAEKQIAVFGIALNDAEMGEVHFLPIIGEKHIAGMPYEIILQGNIATILHGRYRFASHWPELTMGTFTKIMSSPGDVEDMLKALTE